MYHLFSPLLVSNMFAHNKKKKVDELLFPFLVLTISKTHLSRYKTFSIKGVYGLIGSPRSKSAVWNIFQIESQSRLTGLFSLSSRVIQLQPRSCLANDLNNCPRCHANTKCTPAGTCLSYGYTIVAKCTFSNICNMFCNLHITTVTTRFQINTLSRIWGNATNN